MDLLNFKSINTCNTDDATLTAHVHSALARGLPELFKGPQHEIVAVLVGSGPTVAGQLDSLRRQRKRGRPIFAMNEAHDWLISRDFIPDYAVAVDAQDHVQKWFANKRKDVKYWIASQCHPKTFDHLSDCQVWLWHLEFNKGKAFPPTAMRICGCTTTGLRTITLLYVMGFRRFELYGYDSCLQDGTLRVNGDAPPEKDEIIPMIVELAPGNRRLFYCNPGMAGQADEFQELFTMMPDIAIQSYGDGLITAILDARERAAMATQLAMAPQLEVVT
jgi:6-hydroxymethylpterin diphosphokinase MptE-like protein